jgi:hypothetical protein
MSSISINDLHSAKADVSEGMESLINEIRDLSDTELNLSGGKGHGKRKGHGGGDDDDDDDDDGGHGGGHGGNCYGGGDDDDD